METPEDRSYTSDHEWAVRESDLVRVGITDYAQDALGDVVFVQLPEVGKQVDAGVSCSEVESTKSVSEIYAPVSGEIVEVNASLTDKPELINTAPYADGWLFVVRSSDHAEFEKLLTPAAYKELTEH